MPDIIDIHDLLAEDVRFIVKLIDILREKAKISKVKEKEEIKFATWPLGVKGKLTRREIYDYL